jgi:tripartite-type tricarboxylate transporter receptor subunit TctC
MHSAAISYIAIFRRLRSILSKGHGFRLVQSLVVMPRLHWRNWRDRVPKQKNNDREKTMTFKPWGTMLGLAMTGLLASGLGVQAETAEEFYSGKTVTLMVAAEAGGFADTIARSFATEFQKNFPGHPEFIVVNKPGAGGLVAASQLQNSEAKDGTTIGFLLGNVLTTPLVTGKENQFDPHKVQWIGSIENGDYPYALYANTTAGINSPEDLMANKLVLGATSFTNYNRVFPALMNDYIGTKIDIVSGYKGSGEVYLALERGEVSGWMEGSHAIVNETNKAGQMIAAGTLKPVMLMATAKDMRWPDLPVLQDYLKDDEQRAVAGFLMDSSAAGRPIAVPAEVPEERVAAIRAAFEATLDNPETVQHLKDMLKTPVVVKISAGTIDEMVSAFYAATPEVLEKVRSFMVQ